MVKSEIEPTKYGSVDHPFINKKQQQLSYKVRVLKGLLIDDL